MPHQQVGSPTLKAPAPLQRGHLYKEGCQGLRRGEHHTCSHVALASLCGKPVITRREQNEVLEHRVQLGHSSSSQDFNQLKDAPEFRWGSMCQLDCC